RSLSLSLTLSHTHTHTHTHTLTHSHTHTHSFHPLPDQRAWATCARGQHKIEGNRKPWKACTDEKIGVSLHQISDYSLHRIESALQYSHFTEQTCLLTTPPHTHTHTHM